MRCIDVSVITMRWHIKLSIILWAFGWNEGFAYNASEYYMHTTNPIIIDSRASHYYHHAGGKGHYARRIDNVTHTEILASMDLAPVTIATCSPTGRIPPMMYHTPCGHMSSACECVRLQQRTLDDSMTSSWWRLACDFIMLVPVGWTGSVIHLVEPITIMKFARPTRTQRFYDYMHINCMSYYAVNSAQTLSSASRQRRWWSSGGIYSDAKWAIYRTWASPFFGSSKIVPTSTSECVATKRGFFIMFRIGTCTRVYLLESNVHCTNIPEEPTQSERTHNDDVGAFFLWPVQWCFCGATIVVWLRIVLPEILASNVRIQSGGHGKVMTNERTEYILFN